MENEILKNSIIKRCANLAFAQEWNAATLEECITEYTEQFEEHSENRWLRKWLGWMIEDKNTEAIEIMKDLIRYNISLMLFTNIPV